MARPILPQKRNIIVAMHRARRRSYNQHVREQQLISRCVLDITCILNIYAHMYTYIYFANSRALRRYGDG